MQLIKAKRFNCFSPQSPTLQLYKNLKKQNLKSWHDKILSSKMPWFLSFQVAHQIAEEIIFQTPRTQLFFILLLQATTTSLTLEGWTQLTPIREREISKRRNLPTMHNEMIHRFFPLQTHRVAPKFLLLSVSSIGILPMPYGGCPSKETHFVGTLDF